VARGAQPQQPFQLVIELADGKARHVVFRTLSLVKKGK
jgi:hypothetical protein